MQKRKHPSGTNPAKDIMESNKDDVGTNSTIHICQLQNNGGINQIISQWTINRTKPTIKFLDIKMGVGKLNWMPHWAQKLLAQVVSFLVLFLLIQSIFWRIAMNDLVVVLGFL